jgi:hypothetical protein
MTLLSCLFRLVIASAALTATAQDGHPGSGPPPPPPPHGPPPRGKGDWHSGGKRHHDGGFDRLPEKDKEKVRAALDQAWKKPEVIAAREHLMKANDDFRNTLREALQGIDPEAVKLLDAVKPETPSLMSQPWPNEDAPDFVDAALGRIGKELSLFAKPDRREEMLRLHREMLDHATVKPLVEALRTAPVGKPRGEALRKLLPAYWKLARELRDKHKATAAAKAAPDTK